MSTYEDLRYEIPREITTVRAALRWLDEHPEAMPSPTITESEVREAWGTTAIGAPRAFLRDLGITIIPDPEPTNAEKLATILNGSVQVTYGNLGPLAEFLDEAGVKAPEGEL